MNFENTDFIAQMTLQHACKCTHVHTYTQTGIHFCIYTNVHTHMHTHMLTHHIILIPYNIRDCIITKLQPYSAFTGEH